MRPRWSQPEEDQGLSGGGRELLHQCRRAGADEPGHRPPRHGPALRHGPLSEVSQLWSRLPAGNIVGGGLQDQAAVAALRNRDFQRAYDLTKQAVEAHPNDFREHLPRADPTAHQVSRPRPSPSSAWESTWPRPTPIAGST